MPINGVQTQLIMRLIAVLLAAVPMILCYRKGRGKLMSFVLFLIVTVYEAVAFSLYLLAQKDIFTTSLHPSLFAGWILLFIAAVTVLIVRARLEAIMTSGSEVAQYLEYFATKITRSAEKRALKKAKRKPFSVKKLKTWLIVFGSFAVLAALNVLYRVLFQHESGIHFEVFPTFLPGMREYGITDTVVSAWIVTGMALVLGLIVRFVLAPRFKDIPSGFQSFLEFIIGAVEKYTKDNVHGVGPSLPIFGMTVGTMIIFSGVLELCGLRSATTDYMLTVTMALFAFVLINIYGIAKKGFVGRFKSFFHPIPLLAPINMLTSLAIPLSLSLRLFGNMLGGMIMMELIYGVASVGIPAAMAPLFVLFHMAMQSFIFVTLMLTYVGEATE